MVTKVQRKKRLEYAVSLAEARDGRRGGRDLGAALRMLGFDVSRPVDVELRPDGAVVYIQEKTRSKK